jgi:hypothetical protein
VLENVYYEVERRRFGAVLSAVWLDEVGKPGRVALRPGFSSVRGLYGEG